ncbi:SUKH-4 family immunity protein [Streptomyces sp. BK205]|uniref:SUKH-4 family immunity protein n=1 Tax=Streptomyces TaxID=1883 RepID=UPI0010504D1E|nr:SUKH-4 family immunity protein [Streptomyces sp. BK205]TCR18954.1 SUKH-4 immunity protein of toxin-antitoxin system [Streptomyces sp. BK205]
MPPLVDHAMMESVFPAEEIETWQEEKLPAQLHASARRVLTEVGLPHDRSSFFLLDGALFEGEDTPSGFRRCADLDHFSEYEDMPQGWEKWLVIGEIFYDVVVLDPESGTVYCLPDGDYRALPLNRSLDSFAYFTYLLQLERPKYDYSVSEDVDDSEDVAISLRGRMIEADPLPFEGVEPAWSEEFDWDDEDAPSLPPWDAVLSNVYESID